MELTVISPGTNNIITDRSNDTITLAPIYAMEKSNVLQYDIQMQTIGTGIVLGTCHEKYRRNERIYSLYSENHDEPVVIMIVPDTTELVLMDGEYVEIYNTECIVRLKFEETGQSKTIVFPMSLDKDSFDQDFIDKDEKDMIFIIMNYLKPIISGKISYPETEYPAVYGVEPESVLARYIRVKTLR